MMPSSTAPNWLLPKHSQKLMQPNTPPRMAPLAGPMTMAPTMTGTISRVISSPGILIMPSPVTSSSSIMATSTEMRTRSCTVYFPRFVSLFILLPPAAASVQQSAALARMIPHFRVFAIADFKKVPPASPGVLVVCRTIGPAKPGYWLCAAV